MRDVRCEETISLAHRLGAPIIILCLCALSSPTRGDEVSAAAKPNAHARVIDESLNNVPLPPWPGKSMARNGRPAAVNSSSKGSQTE